MYGKPAIHMRSPCDRILFYKPGPTGPLTFSRCDCLPACPPLATARHRNLRSCRISRQSRSTGRLRVGVLHSRATRPLDCLHHRALKLYHVDVTDTGLCRSDNTPYLTRGEAPGGGSEPEFRCSRKRANYKEFYCSQTGIHPHYRGTS